MMKSSLKCRAKCGMREKSAHSGSVVGVVSERRKSQKMRSLALDY